jgi:hypothetical protein
MPKKIIISFTIPPLEIELRKLIEEREKLDQLLTKKLKGGKKKNEREL